MLPAPDTAALRSTDLRAGPAELLVMPCVVIATPILPSEAGEDEDSLVPCATGARKSICETLHNDCDGPTTARGRMMSPLISAAAR
jgi:hypothetical protein